MSTQGVLTDHGRDALRQPIESAAHVGGFAGHPDPRSLCAIHGLQTRQPNHPALSTTASSARSCSASHPRPTTRLRPFRSRTSIRESSGTLSVGSASCTSKNLENFAATLPCSRFFHAKKYGLHRSRSRQKAVTVCPLRCCSETNLRHFLNAFFVRRVMAQHCYAPQFFTRWGSFSAHGYSDGLLH